MVIYFHNGHMDKEDLIFHVDILLAEDSHEISSHFFTEN